MSSIVTADVFTYDELNRLRKDLFYYHNGSSFTNTDDKYGNQYTYDANGNITTLQRKSLLPTTGAVSVMDNLTYNYANQNSDNKLTSLSETAANADFTDDLDGGQIPNNYTYDASGNLTGDDAEKLQIQWNAKGKVTQVTDNSTTPAKIITFEYDANGNRVKKTVDLGSTNCADNNVTYYVYSEKGTVLATYKRKGCFETAMPIILADHTIQSNQRMGLRNYPQTGNTVQLDNVAQNNTQGYSSRELFRKHYELSDHLGNVRAVISDAKWSYNGIMTPHIISYTNYYPFGMAQAGRNWSNGGYRFGYNGQEKDDEIKGSGNSYNFEFRMHDPRVGRFLSLDPLAPKYPWNSPYAFAENRVIDGIELEGLEYLTVRRKIYYGKPIQVSYEWTNSIDRDNEGYLGYEGFRVINEHHYENGGIDYSKTSTRDYKRGYWLNGDYGNYYGGTSFPNVFEYKNYLIPPINSVDYFAMLHDKAYDEIKAVGAGSLLNDWGTIPADEAAIAGWMSVLSQGITAPDPKKNGQPFGSEQANAARYGVILFGDLVWRKKCEIHHFMVKNFPNLAEGKSIDDVHKNFITFRDYYMYFDKELDVWKRYEDKWQNIGTDDEPEWVPIPPKQ